jgi:hypothetical protein
MLPVMSKEPSNNKKKHCATSKLSRIGDRKLVHTASIRTNLRSPILGALAPRNASFYCLTAPKRLLLRLGFCLAVLSLCLYSFLNQQNALTHLKICLPRLEKEIRLIAEENCRLRYEIDRMENPTHLIELAHRPEFGNLKHPLMKEILTLPKGVALKAASERSQFQSRNVEIR